MFNFVKRKGGRCSKRGIRTAPHTHRLPAGLPGGTHFRARIVPGTGTPLLGQPAATGGVPGPDAFGLDEHQNLLEPPVRQLVDVDLEAAGFESARQDLADRAVLEFDVAVDALPEAFAAGLSHRSGHDLLLEVREVFRALDDDLRT